MKFVTALLILLLSVGALSLPGAAAERKDRDPHRAGVAALRAGAIPSAISLFTKAIEQDPGNYRCFNDRGVAYKRAGNLEAALKDYARALEIKPDYENALNNRGVGFLSQGIYDKAIADFTKALKSETLKAKASNNLGMAYAAKGDHREAVKYFNQAISFGGADYGTYLFLADSLRQTGEAEKALRIYHLARGLSKDPEAKKHIDGRISSLKQESGTAGPESGRTSQNEDNRPGRISAAQTDSEREPDVKPSEVRTIVRALSPEENTGKPAAPRAVTDRRDRGNRTELRWGLTNHKAQRDNEVESLQDLEDRIRATAVKSLSPVAAQIYAQGREFHEKSDTAKALIRFEDTRQLERRKRSYYGVAWSNVEIGRAYSALGEHHKATPYFEESLRFFKRLGAQNESIFAMTELAKNQRAVRGKGESAGSFEKAVEMAVSAGHYTLARDIGDESAGKRNQAKKPLAKQGDESPRGTVAQAATTGKPEQEKGLPATVLRAGGNRVESLRPGGRPLKAPKEASTQVVEKPRPVAAAKDGTTTQAPKTEKASVEESARRPAASAGKTDGTDKGSVQTAKPDSRKLILEKVGSGTNWYVKWAGRAKDGRRPLVTADAAGPAPEEPAEAKAEPQPKRIELLPKHPGPSADRHASGKRKASRTPSGRKPIETDLDELRRLKAQNDERGMVVVLERVARHYVNLNEYDKALQCLDASLGLRDDLRFMKGESEALEQRGRVKEKLGHTAQGLEDLSKALALGASRPGSEIEALRADAKKSASRLGLDADMVLRTFDSLWTARKEGDGIGETRALFRLGEIYEKSGRNPESLIYYQRASASLLADSALLHEKMGRKDMAGKLYDQAMEALKEFDYSRFIELKRKSRVPKTISRQ
ncbi:MAG: tetratricopeptide repeat protein [Pseudomonadota bacterium]